VVVATGLATEIGSLHKTIEGIDTETPLKHDLDRLSHMIVIGLFVLCAILFGIGLALGKTLIELLVILTALFICAIPEGLPVVFTLVLVGGVYRMAKQHVLVKKLQAAESLGRTDIIIIDKTGTLTRNEMTVHTVHSQEQEYKVTGEGYQTNGTILYKDKPLDPTAHPSLLLLAEAASFLNSAEINYLTNGQAQVKGDPTEAAMGIFAQKAGLNQHELEQHYKKIGEIPFSSELRFHAGFYQHNESLHVFVAGVPEIITSFCAIKPAWIETALHSLLEKGLRAVSLAHYSMPLPQEVPDNWITFFTQKVAGQLTCLGLLGMQDPLRPGIADAVIKARSSGIRVIMATGDHAATAFLIGKAAGMVESIDDVMEGRTLRSLSPLEQEAALAHVRVFSRVTPQDKLLLVNLFHKEGHIVAMTGDGVNDVPSIAAADVGIAMGISGTDITKEAADLILLDDSFSSIVDAIEEGRHIFYTLRRVISYFFATNLGEILIIMIALLANLPLPLLAAQILWLNLVTDGFLDVALAQEPKEKGLLQKAWLRNAQHYGLINKHLLFRISLTALPMAAGSLALFMWYQADLALARTITLTCMAMFQWFNAWNCRSETISLSKLNITSNAWLVMATSLVFVLQLAVVYVPLLQKMFATVPLSLMQWTLIILISSSIIVIEELRKAIAAWLTRNHNQSSL
jgi:Ca2+-transporting ATPase